MFAILRAFKPSVLIRRKAMYSGLLGPSKVWRAIALWVFGKTLIKRFFGRNEEVLDLGTLSVGRFMSIETAKPVSKRRRRKLAKAGTPLPSRKELQALATIEADAAVIARKRRRR